LRELDRRQQIGAIPLNGEMSEFRVGLAGRQIVVGVVGFANEVRRADAQPHEIHADAVGRVDQGIDHLLAFRGGKFGEVLARGVFERRAEAQQEAEGQRPNPRDRDDLRRLQAPAGKQQPQRNE